MDIATKKIQQRINVEVSRMKKSGIQFCEELNKRGTGALITEALGLPPIDHALLIIDPNIEVSIINLKYVPVEISKGIKMTRCHVPDLHLDGYGMYKKLANTFKEMVKRTTNSNCADFINYGGRGISCKYKNAVDIYNDIGLPPGQEYTIDRIDNDGDYRVGNCKWATRAEQARNMRRNINIVKDGRKMVLTDFVDEFCPHVPYSTITYRINERGLTVEEALLESGVAI